MGGGKQAATWKSSIGAEAAARSRGSSRSGPPGPACRLSWLAVTRQHRRAIHLNEGERREGREGRRSAVHCTPPEDATALMWSSHACAMRACPDEVWDGLLRTDGGGGGEERGEEANRVAVGAGRWRDDGDHDLVTRGLAGGGRCQILCALASALRVRRAGILLMALASVRLFFLDRRRHQLRGEAPHSTICAHAQHNH